MSDEVITPAVVVDTSPAALKDTSSPGFWLSLFSSVLDSANSLWETHFGNGVVVIPNVPAVSAGTGAAATGSGGSASTAGSSNFGALILIGGAFVALFLVMRGLRRKH
jgi:hypothetical protein